MTNAEKYLKDGVDERELFEKICLVFYDGGYNDFDVLKLEKFFNKQAIPTLTEDERVILRNIDKGKYTRVGRKLGGALYLGLKSRIGLDSTFDDFFGEDLFQFIEERRRI